MFEVGKKYNYLPKNGSINTVLYIYVGFVLNKHVWMSTHTFDVFTSSDGPERWKEYKEPVKFSGWVNFYSKDKPTPSRNWFSTKDEAVYLGKLSGNYLTTLYVSGEEGKEPTNG